MVFLKILLLHCFRHSACQMVIMQIADVPAPNKLIYNLLSFSYTRFLFIKSSALRLPQKSKKLVVFDMRIWYDKYGDI